jgi:hypothetical protein
MNDRNGNELKNKEMFKIIQGICQKGKICIPQFIEVKDEAEVLIVFSDSSGKSGKTAEVCAEIPLISFAGSDTLKLDSIDVTVSTKEKYNKQVSAQYIRKMTLFNWSEIFIENILLPLLVLFICY